MKLCLEDIFLYEKDNFKVSRKSFLVLCNFDHEMMGHTIYLKDNTMNFVHIQQMFLKKDFLVWSQ